MIITMIYISTQLQSKHLKIKTNNFIAFLMQYYVSFYFCVASAVAINDKWHNTVNAFMQA